MRLFGILPLLLISFVSIPASLAQDSAQEYASGLLILSDGSELAIRGDYEVLGDRVQFAMGPNEEPHSLPLAKVDLEATERANAELREKAEFRRRQAAGKSSLAEEVERYQNEQSQSGKTITNEDLKRANPDSNRGQQQRSPEPSGGGQAQDQDYMEQVRELEKEMERWIEEIALNHATELMVFLILFLVTTIAALITHLYLIITSFRYSSSWGWWLVITATLPFFIGCAGVFLPSAILLAIVNVVTGLIQLAHLILLLIHIFSHRINKFIYLFLLFSPLVVSIVFLWMLTRWGLLDIATLSGGM